MISRKHLTSELLIVSLVFVIHLVGLRALKPQEVARPVSSSKLLRGRVIDVDTQLGVADAVVTLGSAIDAASGSTARRSALTDSAGRFVLFDVLPGMYPSPAVEAIAYSGGYYGRDRTLERPGLLEIGSEGAVPELVFRICKSSSISGRVVDEAGEPVPEVVVQAFRLAVVAGIRRPETGRSDTTDDRGVYRIAGLNAGEYVVGLLATASTIPKSIVERGSPTSRAEATAMSVQDSELLSSGAPTARLNGIVVNSTIFVTPTTSAPRAPLVFDPDGSFTTYAAVFYPGANTLDGATPIALRAGGHMDDVDLHVRPTSSVMVSGAVESSTLSIGNLGVRLIPIAASGRPEERVAATTATDGRGHFTFIGVSPGEYEVRVIGVPPPVFSGGSFRLHEVDGLRALTTGGPAGSFSAVPVARGLRWATQRVSVADIAVSGLRLSLEPGLRVRGQLHFDGSVPVPSSDRLGQILMALEAADGSAIFPQSRTARGVVSSTGSFEVDDVPSGRYVIRLGRLPEGWSLESADLNGRDWSYEPIQINRDELAVRVTLTDKPATISGVVRSTQQTDAPVVVAFPVNRNAWTDYGHQPRHLQQVLTGSGGRYVLKGLPAGEYYLAALRSEQNDDWRDPQNLSRVIPTAQRVSLGRREQKITDLRPVSVSSFKLVPSPPMQHTFSADAATMESYGGPYEPDGTHGNVVRTAQSESTGRLRGRVVTGNNERIRRALITVKGALLKVDRVSVSDDDGFFGFDNLPIGHYSVSASKVGYVTARYGRPGVVVSVRVGDPVTIAVHLQKAGVIAGTVRNEMGNPVNLASVRAYAVRKDGRGVVLSPATGRVEVQSDDLGEYRLYGLTSGEYVVMTRPPITAPNGYSVLSAEIAAWLADASSVAAGASLPLGRTVSYGRTYFPGTADLGSATVIKLKAGQEIGQVDIVMARSRTARLEGRVLIPEGYRLGQSFSLNLLTSNQEPIVVSSTSVGLSGKFSLSSVPPGQYVLSASTTLLKPNGDRTIPSRFWAETAIVSDGNDIENLQLVLLPGIAISGRVGIDGESSPGVGLLSTVRVRLKALDSTPAGLVASVTPARDGTFSIPGVAPGRYVIEGLLLPPSDQRFFVKSVQYEQALHPAEVLVVSTSTSQIADLFVTLSEHMGEIAGTVTDNDGRPAQDVVVLAIPADSSNWFEGSLRFRPPAQTSRTGGFRIAGLAVGEYRLAILTYFDRSNWPEPAFFEQLVADGIGVVLTAGEKRVQNLVIRD